MKTILITGASGGIGSAISSFFAKNEYSVLINYNNDKNGADRVLEKIKASGKDVVSFKADVSKFSEVEKMFDYFISQFGHIDVLINNAGVSLQKVFQDVTEKESDLLFKVNVGSALNCSSVALKYMIPRKKGKIINISSIWGIVGASMEVHYSASKAALIGFTKALAKEVGPSGINVNCIAPGVIDTKMNSFDNETKNEIIYNTPLQKIGDPLDVAKLALFLASDDSNFITGQVISPNGGFTIY